MQRVVARRNSARSGPAELVHVRRGGHHERPPRRVVRWNGQAYWTVIVPFMPIAACGVQSKSYLPAGILAKDTVYSSFGCMSSGLESSAMCWPGMFALSWALVVGSVRLRNATLCGPPETMM